MIQLYYLKALNQVLITFFQTAILECTLKVVGHFACWSHCVPAGAMFMQPIKPAMCNFSRAL